MHTFLASHRLRDGTTLEVGRVEGPDLRWADRIVPFLGHKGGLWTRQIEETLREDTRPLLSRYYVGLIDEELAGTVCTFVYRGVGILGHVFTSPEHRGKGVCRAVMTTQIEDFRAEGGEALFLGTGYDSPAYHIYSRFGFTSITPGSGEMEYYRDGIESYESMRFAPRTARIRNSDWRDWAGYTGLACQTRGSPVRSVLLSLYGRRSMEGPYLSLRHTIVSHPKARLQSLETTDDGAVVGMAWSAPDPRFPGVALCDLCVHPFYKEHAAPLAAATVPENGRCHAYAEADDEPTIAAFESRGLSVEARLPDAIVVGGRPVSLVLLCR